MTGPTDHQLQSLADFGRRCPTWAVVAEPHPWRPVSVDPVRRVVRLDLALAGDDLTGALHRAAAVVEHLDDARRHHRVPQQRLDR